MYVTMLWDSQGFAMLKTPDNGLGFSTILKPKRRWDYESV